jgi:hypothetical protein
MKTKLNATLHRDELLISCRDYRALGEVAQQVDDLLAMCADNDDPASGDAPLPPDHGLKLDVRLYNVGGEAFRASVSVVREDGADLAELDLEGVIDVLATVAGMLELQAAD